MNGNMTQSYDDGSTGEGAQTYNTEAPDFLRELVSVDDVLENFEHRVLRGEIRQINYNTGRPFWNPIPGTKLMNEIGVREIMSRVIGKVTKIARLTYKEDEEVYKDLFYFHMSIAEMFAKRLDHWEMSEEVAKSLMDACLELVWDIACSSRSGFFAINLRTQYSRSDISRSDTGSQQQSVKRGFLGGLFGKK